jgi:hypothetical protein
MDAKEENPCKHFSKEQNRGGSGDFQGKSFIQEHLEAVTDVRAPMEEWNLEIERLVTQGTKDSDHLMCLLESTRRRLEEVQHEAVSIKYGDVAE